MWPMKGPFLLRLSGIPCWVLQRSHHKMLRRIHELPRASVTKVLNREAVENNRYGFLSEDQGHKMEVYMTVVPAGL